jgi:acetyltransferase-like isoleucine patch superfamily enzyme
MNRIKNIIKKYLFFWFPQKPYTVDKTAILEVKKLITIKEKAEIQEYVIIRTYRNPVIIGKYTQINPFTVIYGGSGVYIGDNVMIAPHCMFASGNHNLNQKEKPMRFATDISKGPIHIGDDVWIGANCTITDGVKIGNGSVIGANSVVTSDVPEYSIYAGTPAKFIRKR